MEEKRGFAVPPLVATAAGLAVGGFFGQSAGEAIAETVTPHLPLGLNEHSGTLTHLTEAVTAFGGAVVGHMLAAEKPAEAVVLALAAAPALLSKVHHDHPSVAPETPYVPDVGEDAEGGMLLEPVSPAPSDVVTWPDLMMATGAFALAHALSHGESAACAPTDAAASADGHDKAGGEVVETSLHVL